MNTLSKRLTYALEKKGLKQVDLAQSIGVSAAAVNKWLKGNTKNLRGAHLVAVANLLNVSVAWLAAGDEKQQITLPFHTITLDDLFAFPPDYIEDIEEYILMKKQKLQKKQSTDLSKKIA